MRAKNIIEEPIKLQVPGGMLLAYLDCIHAYPGVAGKGMPPKSAQKKPGPAG